MIFGRLSKYSFINAKLKSKISKLLDDDFFDQLIRSYGYDESIQLLKHTPYQQATDVYEKTGDFKLFELELMKHEIRLYSEIEKKLKDRNLNFLRTLKLKFEIENLKYALRLWFDCTVRERNIDGRTGYIFCGKIVNDLDYSRIIDNANASDVIASLQSSEYKSVLMETLPLAETKKTLFFAESALDKYFYEKLYESALLLPKYDYKIVAQLLSSEIDVYNLSWIIRFKNFYHDKSDINPDAYLIPNRFHHAGADKKGKKSVDILKAFGSQYNMSGIDMESRDNTAKLAFIERMLSELINIQIKKIRLGNPFTIGIMLSYFLLVNKEVSKISTILNAKYYEMSEDKIRTLL